MPKWTKEELQYLRNNYGKMPNKEIARTLGKTIPAINGMAGRLKLRRKKEPKWTPEEDRFLQENWYNMTMRTLAQKLNRTRIAIDVRAKKLKLGPQVNPGMFTLRDICDLLKIDHRKVKKYIAAGRLKAKKAPVKTALGHDILLFSPSTVRKFILDYPEAWDSRRVDIIEVIRAIRLKERKAEQIEVKRESNDDDDFQERRIPKHLKPAFARFVADVAMSAAEKIRVARAQAKQELDRLRQKQEQDHARKYPREGLPWTQEEDERLRRMFKSGRYTYREMGERLGRSQAAVGHRLARIVIWDEQAS